MCDVKKAWWAIVELKYGSIPMVGVVIIESDELTREVFVWRCWVFQMGVGHISDCSIFPVIMNWQAHETVERVKVGLVVQVFRRWSFCLTLNIIGFFP